MATKSAKRERPGKSHPLREALAKVKSRVAAAVESEAGAELAVTHRKVRARVRRELQAVKKARAPKRRRASR